jgi:putative transposase
MLNILSMSGVLSMIISRKLSEKKSVKKSVKKSKTPSFITEVPLKVDSTQQRTLLARFEAGRQLYNACLSEALRRKSLMQESKAYQDARKLPRKVNGKPNKERLGAFHACDAHFGFRKYDLQKFAKETKNACWIGDHLDSLSTQTISDRAFRAVQKLIFDPKCKRVRFKGKNQFDSIEGKTNTCGIRFKENQLVWGKLKLDCIRDEEDKVVAHALKHRIKYCRLIKRKLNRRIRFYAQLVTEGIPYQKFKSPKKGVGLDVGPSTIAHVSDSHAKLEKFCDPLSDKQKEIRRLQHKMDRQRHANNPDKQRNSYCYFLCESLRKRDGFKNPKLFRLGSRQYNTPKKGMSMLKSEAKVEESVVINRVLQCLIEMPPLVP